MSDSPASTLPSAAMAKLLDITPRRLQQGAEEGWAVRASRGRWEMIPTVHGYVRSLRALAAGDTDDYREERTGLAATKRQIAELDLAERKGELIPAGDIEAFGVGLVSMMQTRVLAVPSKAAPDAHSAASIAEVEKILRDHVVEALEKIASAKWSDLTEAYKAKIAEKS